MLRFVVSRYRLREAARGYWLSDKEKAELVESERLLQLPSSASPAIECREAARLREDLRRRLMLMRMPDLRTPNPN